MLQALVEWPGILQFETATLSLTHGISPNVAIISLLPQKKRVEEYGTLIFKFTGGGRTFVECKADYSCAEFNESGEIWQIAILDRRWRWRFGAISGSYNIRDEDQYVKASSEKTPQELAQLCLLAMEEDKWDVSALPNDTRPEINWDYDNPAAALAELCDTLNCRIVPKFDCRKGTIVAPGDGVELPKGGVENTAETYNPPEIPDKIGIVCGPTLYQADFSLEPVGLEVDLSGGDTGRQDAIDRIDNLSYKPAEEWKDVLPGDRQTIYDQFGEDEAEAAEASVWKWFRLKLPDDGFYIQGFSEVNGPISSLFQVEWQDSLVQTADDADVYEADGATKRRLPATVHGVWYDTRWDGSFDNVKENVDPSQYTDGKCPFPFSIEPQRRLVKFGKHVYRNAAGVAPCVEPLPPELYLTTACTLRDPKTMAPVRYTRPRVTGSSGNTTTHYESHPEIVLAYVKGETVNQEAVDKECDYYLDAIMRQYQDVRPESATYSGLVDIHLDGAIQQVSYRIDASGASTTVSRNTELLTHVTPYAERRRQERLREDQKRGRRADRMIILVPQAAFGGNK